MKNNILATEMTNPTSVSRDKGFVKLRLSIRRLSGSHHPQSGIAVEI